MVKVVKKRKRITKKQLKEDKFVEATLQVTRFITDYSKQLIGVAIGIIILIIVIYVILQQRAQANEEALALLCEANMEYHRESYQSAILQYQKLLDKYGGTDSSKDALFYLGNSYFFIAQYDSAIMVFQQLIDKSKNDNIITPAALAGLAAAYSQKNDYEQAAKFYEKAAEKFPQNFLSPENLLAAGRCYEAIGEYDKAISVYEKIVSLYPESSSAEVAKIAKTELAAKQ